MINSRGVQLKNSIVYRKCEKNDKFQGCTAEKFQKFTGNAQKICKLREQLKNFRNLPEKRHETFEVYQEVQVV
jgi:hypothetical protein